MHFQNQSFRYLIWYVKYIFERISATNGVERGVACSAELHDRVRHQRIGRPEQDDDERQHHARIGKKEEKKAVRVRSGTFIANECIFVKCESCLAWLLSNAPINQINQSKFKRLKRCILRSARIVIAQIHHNVLTNAICAAVNGSKSWRHSHRAAQW